MRNLTVIDRDRVERSNLSRQFYSGEDIGFSKAQCLSRHVAGEMTSQERIVGLGMLFEEAVEEHDLCCDLLIVGVDNNACRLAAVKFTRSRGIPAVFSMLSLDGLRCQVFLQGRGEYDACFWCALPNLDPETSLPCAASIISSCFLASSFALFFAHRALMGWPKGVEPFNWREADLTGAGLDRSGLIQRRPNCPVCSRHGREAS